MPIVRTCDMLREAEKGDYAVTAFDTFNYETIQMAVETAEELEAPIIIMIYPDFREYINLKTFAALTRAIGEQSKYPVSIMLDHGDSFELAMECIRAGFSSVMVDFSALPFEENVRQTAKVVEAAHAMGVDVEAELGHTGDADCLADYTDSSKYTDPDQAAEFVERTGCDVLAVAFGSAHGIYVQEPKLDMTRLKDIRRKVKIPLVLHGGTGIPNEQIQEAVKIGIRKLNIGTGYDKAMYTQLQKDILAGDKEPLFLMEMQEVRRAAKRFLEEKIRLTKYPEVRI